MWWARKPTGGLFLMRPAPHPRPGTRDHATTDGCPNSACDVNTEVAVHMVSGCLRQRQTPVVHSKPNSWCFAPPDGHSGDVRTLTALLISILLAAAGSPTASGAAFDLAAPLPGRIVRGYDDVGRFSAGHRGVDLAGRHAEPVAAAAQGIVHFAGLVAGRPSVSIDHGNGWRTTYLPVVASVARGDAVERGQRIGNLVAGHCAAEVCLHWGLTDGAAYADPTAFLESPVVRLLPQGSQPQRPPSIRAARVAEFGLPLSGPVTSRFGLRVHPVTGVYKLHDGVDLGASCGTPVHLPVAGIVTSAGYHGGYGYRVVVDHGGGLVSAYAHLPRVTHRPGTRLGTGDVLGLVGNSGLSTGCHLHWMAWRDDKLVDPLTLVRQGRG